MDGELSRHVDGIRTGKKFGACEEIPYEVRGRTLRNNIIVIVYKFLLDCVIYLYTCLG